jgi:rRNA-processing protein FCF1
MANPKILNRLRSVENNDLFVFAFEDRDESLTRFIYHKSKSNNFIDHLANFIYKQSMFLLTIDDHFLMLNDINDNVPFTHVVDGKLYDLPISAYLEDMTIIKDGDDIIIIKDDFTNFIYYLYKFQIEDFTDIKNKIIVKEKFFIEQYVQKYASEIETYYQENHLLIKLLSGGILPCIEKPPNNEECIISYEHINEFYVECTNSNVQHCFILETYITHVQTNISKAAYCPYCKALMNAQVYKK